LSIAVAGDTTVNIALERGVRLSGCVTGPGGGGLGDVKISAFLAPSGEDTGLPLESRRAGKAHTDAEGSYEMRLLPGTYDLRMAVPPEHGLANPQWLRRVAVRADDTLTILLERGHVLEGRVTDDDGRSALLLSVLALSPGADILEPTAQTQGDIDGVYSFRMPPGVYDLTIWHSRLDGPPSARIKAVPIPGDTVRHLVVDGDGIAIADTR